jgi:hypothetical protein
LNCQIREKEHKTTQALTLYPDGGFVRGLTHFVFESTAETMREESQQIPIEAQGES